jgi:hypothetical protein
MWRPSLPASTIIETAMPLPVPGRRHGCLNVMEASGNGFAVLFKDGTVSARNRRNIYSVKHLYAYI